MRWTAMGALMPFMQLHGRANLAPWTFPEDPEGVTDAYRFWAKLHEAMLPFFYSVAENAYAGSAVKMIEPIGSEAEWAGDYRYVLGGALLVAPVLDDAGTRDIELPAGASFYPLFDPAADASSDLNSDEAADEPAADAPDEPLRGSAPSSTPSSTGANR